MTEIKELHDSGERRKFASGAVRDRGGRKPRPDLISPHAQMREGMIMTLGAEKYGPRNYEKGMPISECVASAQRHIEQYKRGDTNEDHLAQARWNLGAIIHYEEEIKAGRMDPRIDDMPHYATHGLRIEGIVTKPQSESGVPHPFDFCLSCGASIPPRTGEGTCPKCDPNGCRSREADTIPPDHRIVHVPQQEKDHSISVGGLIHELSAPTFYVAGPMRGYRFFNFPAFDEARDRGIALGYNIISPADLDRANGIDPVKWSAEMIAWYDANGWKDLHPEHQCPDSLRDIVTRDTEAIIALEPKRGDGLAILPHWKASIGARAETPLAKWLGLQLVDARDFKTPIEV